VVRSQIVLSLRQQKRYLQSLWDFPRNPLVLYPDLPGSGLKIVHHCLSWEFFAELLPDIDGTSYTSQINYALS